MQERYCQSCAMPMGQTNEMYGTEKDGSQSKDYCKYCYDKGEFNFHGTMEEMLDTCVPYMLKANQDMSEKEARNIMKEFFPTLKRWKQSN